MISRRNRSSLRRSFAFFLLGFALFFSGCVYLRLLELKKQLAKFDSHFQASIADGVSITFLKPLLLESDLRWLGVFPETITRVDNTDIWRVRWLKDVPSEPPEKNVYDVELSARFVDGRLANVTIPERYFQFFSKELFISLLRSTGGARVDRGSRSAEVDNTPLPDAPSMSLPTRESIGGMLGRPTEQTFRDGLAIFRYRYLAVTKEKKAKPIGVTFAFDSASGSLQSFQAELPTATINFRVAPPAKP